MHALSDLLLKGMPASLRLIDRDSDPRLRIGKDGPVCGIDPKSLLDDIVSPRHVGVDRFANDVAWLREAELDRRRRAHRPLGIVRGKCDPMRIGERSDPPGFRKTATVRDVELTDFTTPASEQVAERREMRQSLPRGDRRTDLRIDHCEAVKILRPTRLFEKVEPIRFKGLRKT